MGTLLTIADRGLTVRLTRDLWRLEPEHVALAREVSAVARANGAPADRAAVQEVQLAISAKPDEIDVGFWRAVLGYDPMSDDNAVDRLGHGSTVWMQDLDDAKPLRHAMHVDVSVAREQAGRGSRLPSPPAAGSWSTRTRPAHGSSPIGGESRVHRRVAGRGGVAGRRGARRLTLVTFLPWAGSPR